MSPSVRFPQLESGSSVVSQTAFLPSYVSDGPDSLERFELEPGASQNEKSTDGLFLGHLISLLCPSFLICKMGGGNGSHLRGRVQVSLEQILMRSLAWSSCHQHWGLRRAEIHIKIVYFLKIIGTLLGGSSGFLCSALSIICLL